MLYAKGFIREVRPVFKKGTQEQIIGKEGAKLFKVVMSETLDTFKVKYYNTWTDNPPKTGSKIEVPCSVRVNSYEGKSTVEVTLNFDQSE